MRFERTWCAWQRKPREYDCRNRELCFLAFPSWIPSVVGHGGIGAETPSAPGPNPVERVAPPGENHRACSPVTPQESSGNLEES